MKKLFIALAFMLIGMFAFANTGITTDFDMNTVRKVDLPRQVLGCTSTTVTITNYNTDGSSTSTTTTTVNCDTPTELAQYTVALANLKK
jgi:hypothetical protein